MPRRESRQSRRRQSNRNHQYHCRLSNRNHQYRGRHSSRSWRRPRAPAARFSADAEMIRRRAIQQYHCSLCAGLFPPRERLWWHGQRAWPACSSPPPALRGSATDGACHGRSFKSSFATRSPRSLEQVKRSLEQVKRSCNIKAFASAASAASVRLMAASRRTTEAPPWPSSRRGRISERPYGCRPRPLVLWFAYILSGTMRLEQVDANKQCASN
jgi:hypothetical protein